MDKTTSDTSQSQSSPSRKKSGGKWAFWKGKKKGKHTHDTKRAKSSAVTSIESASPPHTRRSQSDADYISNANRSLSPRAGNNNNNNNLNDINDADKLASIETNKKRRASVSTTISPSESSVSATGNKSGFSAFTSFFRRKKGNEKRENWIRGRFGNTKSVDEYKMPPMFLSHVLMNSVLNIHDCLHESNNST